MVRIVFPRLLRICMCGCCMQSCFAYACRGVPDLAV